MLSMMDPSLRVRYSASCTELKVAQHTPHDKLAIGVWPHASCTVVGLSRHSFLVCGGLRDATDRNTLYSVL